MVEQIRLYPLFIKFFTDHVKSLLINDVILFGDCVCSNLIKTALTCQYIISDQLRQHIPEKQNIPLANAPVMAMTDAGWLNVLVK